MQTSCKLPGEDGIARRAIKDRSWPEVQMSSEGRLLEMVASGHPLPQVLEALCGFAEKVTSKSRCGIYLVDWRSRKFRTVASPTLPSGFNAAIDELSLQYEAIPCARAACTKSQVIAADPLRDVSELQRNRVFLLAQLADDFPVVIGDRVQLEQVILNPLLNASDAMNGVDDRPRKLVIRTDLDATHRARLSVTDTGTGLQSEVLGRLFEPFYTTKLGGMGIGLFVTTSYPGDTP